MAARVRPARGGPLNDDVARGLAVVVPLAPGERAWTGLWADLAPLRGRAEIVFVGPTPPADLPAEVRWVPSPLGRARQLDAGAEATERPWLLFLHADTRLGPGWEDAIADATARHPTALSFFRLRFADDGPWAVRLNAHLANVRAGRLGMPFGDQGFLVARTGFWRLGGFDTTLAAGEDHVFAWRARQRGLGLHQLPATVTTSARKYARDGWARVSARHVRATVVQALPELGRWLVARLVPRRTPRVALAAFVKTPGRSALKTRLAADVGRASADRIYAASVDAAEALLRDGAAAGWEVAWAVAEPDALDHPRWAGLPRLAQGEGGLGARQARVHDALVAGGRVGVLIGADIPQLWLGRIAEAVERLAWCDVVVGPSRDGGFHLLAARRPIPHEVWTGVRYSAPDTLAQLEAALRPLGRVERLAPLTDLDVGADLVALRREIAAAPPGAYGPAQRAALDRVLAEAVPSPDPVETPT